MIKFVALVGALCFFPVPLTFVVHAQQHKAELEVDGVTLHLGMTKAEVTEQLAGKQFWKIDEDNWVSGPPNTIGPAIQFTDGKLTFIERFWATDDNDTTMALFSAVSSLNKDGFHACEVTAGMDISPALTTHDIRISCGEKSVAVTRETIGENAHTTVHEELGEQHEVGKSHAITRRGPNQPHGSSKSLTFISL